jgi:hypothetical protein
MSAVSFTRRGSSCASTKPKRMSLRVSDLARGGFRDGLPDHDTFTSVGGEADDQAITVSCSFMKLSG